MFNTKHESSHAFGGSVAIRGREVSAAYTLTVNDDNVLLVDTSGAAVTVTLPPAADAHDGTCGLAYRVVCLSAANDVTLDGDGAETIDGAATATISGAYAGQTVWSDGAEWFTLS
jgi:hypothetical protein